MDMMPQEHYLQQIEPFSRMEASQRKYVADSMDVVYFPLHSKFTLSSTQNETENASLYFVIKGRIAEYDEEGRQRSLYLHHTFFGETVLLGRESLLNYEVKEEAIVYRLPQAVFLQSILSPNIANYFSDSISAKLDEFHKNLQVASSSEALMGMVSDAILHPLAKVLAKDTLQVAIQNMIAANGDACLIVFDQAQSDALGETHDFGIVTSMDLLKAMATQGKKLTDSVGDIAKRPVITIHQLDYLFNALLKMTRFYINRLVVRDESGPIAILHQKDLMNHFATQSGLGVFSIQQATTLDDLKQVLVQVDELIVSLNHRGVKTHYIAKLVTEIYRKIFEKVFELLNPPEALRSGCFLVMGSEGRAEQVFRTDQDNAFILPDNLNPEQQDLLIVFAEKFTHTLIELGFPKCPGNIMVSNPIWFKSLAEFKAQLKQWMNQNDELSFMYLSIFFDAESVFGEAELLKQSKQMLMQWTKNYPEFIRHFAKPVLQFETPINFFGRLVAEKDGHRSLLDLKKGGIFPIVHGVRCLALENEVLQTNTHWRIKVLMEKGLLSETFGHELGESLNFFNTLRLERMIELKLDEVQREGASVSFNEGNLHNKIQVTSLTSIQQDLLKDAFEVVNRFKKLLTYHFKLETLF